MDEKKWPQPTANEILDAVLTNLHRERGVAKKWEDMTPLASMELGTFIMTPIHEFLRYLIWHEMIVFFPNTEKDKSKSIGWVKIHANGIILIEKGGYVKQQIDTSELNNLNKEKLRIDLANAMRNFKSYPRTQAIAIIGCVIAVFLGFLKLAEALKWWPYNK